MKEITLDTETTGLSPASGHRVVEIGCVEMVSRVRTGRVFHAYLNPERPMPPDAERIHGLSIEFLADKPVFSEKADEFLEFIGKIPLVIHNAGFDVKFLNHELSLLGKMQIGFERVIDTLELARGKFPGQPNNLDALCKRFEVDLSARSKHGALLDAELLAEVYLELTGGRQTRLELTDDVDMDIDGSYDEAPRFEMPLRQFSASPEEKERHRAFIETLTDPVWKKTTVSG